MNIKIELDLNVVKFHVADELAGICEQMTEWIDEEIRLINNSADGSGKKNLLAAKRTLLLTANSLQVYERIREPQG